MNCGDAPHEFKLCPFTSIKVNTKKFFVRILFTLRKTFLQVTFSLTEILEVFGKLLNEKKND